MRKKSENMYNTKTPRRASPTRHPGFYAQVMKPAQLGHGLLSERQGHSVVLDHLGQRLDDLSFQSDHSRARILDLDADLVVGSV